MVDEQAFQGWFNQYADRLGRRANSIRFALWLLLQRQGTEIVEVGSACRAGAWVEDGLSTVVFAAAARQFDFTLTSIDLDPHAIEVSKQLIPGNGVSFVLGDSVDTLAAHESPIDLLYLDSKSYDPKNPSLCQQYTLLEVQQAREVLSDVALVVFDDHALVGGGRGHLAQDYLCDQMGFSTIYVGYQLVLGRMG